MEMQLKVVPEALQVPDRRVGTSLVVGLALAQATIFLGLVPTLLILLPLQIQTLDPVHKTTLMGIASGGGAILAMLANPLVGALSDRTTSRFGRRRPWILAGALLIPSSLLAMMNATSILVLIIATLGLQIALNVTLAGTAAILPDQVPIQQRGLVGGLVGMAAPLAAMAGSVLIGSLSHDMRLCYLLIAGTTFIILAPFAILLPDKPLPSGYVQRFHLGEFLKNFWISPRKYPDFARVWLARCLSSVGYYSVLAFLLYYLQDVVHYTRLFPTQSITQGVAILTVLSTLMMLLAAFVSGLLSDRLQRRKPFVVVASVLMTLGLLVFALFPSWIGAVVAEVILGLGFGMYGSVDQALATQVLPSEQDRAKDMGVINIANILPQTLASALAVPILFWTNSYTLLFILTALITLSGSWFVFGIKSVR